MSEFSAELTFLVTGTARSGTTLVQRLCCELPSVWIPAETHFWTSAGELAGTFEWPLRAEDREDAAEYVLQHLAGGELPVTVGSLVGEMTGRRRRIGLWTVFESLVAAMSPPGTMVLGEKTPNHMFWWELLTADHPGLKLVVVTRDPRAVLRSHRNVPWGERDPAALAERWLAHQRAASDARRILGPGRVLTLRYEDVAADAGAARSRIATFLGVPDRPEPLAGDLLAEFPLFPKREQWKARALDPVDRDRIAAGEEIAAADAAVVESICGPCMSEFGYETYGPPEPLPPPEGETLDRVLAFRRWHASVVCSTDLPDY